MSHYLTILLQQPASVATFEGTKLEGPQNIVTKYSVCIHI